ncbi:MAG: AAA family ATPase [Desulfobulbaceae bacterium]
MFQSGAKTSEVIERIHQIIEVGRPPSSVPRLTELAVRAEELSAARISPRCIVRDYLFADVATLAAPGGTGKTTLILCEIVCIILARPVHGLEVVTPGPCLIVTAEDRREQLVARLREIMQAMELTEEEEAAAMGFIWIWDVTGEPLRLVEARDGNITVTALADDIVKNFQANPPVLVVFDPVVSFGASESFVNDNEQGIITACRRIVRGLGCCVRLVAHTGKANAREATLDQYSSRGGSALSDGARMVSVLQSWQPSSALRPPEACIDLPRASITILARPKLSYAAANLPLIWIRRTGWKFEAFNDLQLNPEERAGQQAEKMLSFLASEVAAGCRHNKTSLETAIPGMARTVARKTISQLMARGKIIEVDLPADEQKTRRKTYLITAAGFGRISENEKINSAEKNQINNAAAYREYNGGIIPPPIIPPVPDSPAAFRQDSAGLAGLKDNAGQEVRV